MKLSELIEALGRMGINIISPHEMLNREYFLSSPLLFTLNSDIWPGEQVAMDAEIAAQEASEYPSSV